MSDSSDQFSADLLSDILSRLPAKTLLIFKSVSKLWLSIIQHPTFASMHAKRISHASTTTLLCITQDSDTVKLRQINWTGGVNAVITELRPLPKELSNNCPTLIGSSNGVLCLRADNTTLFLWNPLSNRVRPLPPLPPPPPPPRPRPKAPRVESYNYDRHLCTYGFGYDEVNDDYKVLCFQVSVQEYWGLSEYGLSHLAGIPEDRVVVYSLKSNTWRSVDDFPIPLHAGEAGVLSNGALHWIGKGGGHRPLVGFDLATEEFKRFSLRCPRGHLGGLLDGGICQTVEMMKGYYHIAVMSEGSYSRWLEFKFKPGGDHLELRPRRRLPGQPFEELDKGRCLRPIAYVETPKPLVMIYQEGFGNNLCFYDFKSTPVTEGEASDVKFSKEVFPYIQTLELC